MWIFSPFFYLMMERYKNSQIAFCFWVFFAIAVELTDDKVPFFTIIVKVHLVRHAVVLMADLVMVI